MSATAFQTISPASLPKVTSKSWLTGMSLIAADAVAVTVVTVLMFSLAPAWHEPFKEAILQGISTLLIFAGLGLYPGHGLGPAREFRGILIGSAVGSALTASALLARGGASPVGADLWFAWAATCVLVIVGRAAVRGLCSRTSWWGTPAVIFGSGQTAHATLRHILAHPSMGLRVVAIFDERCPDWPELDDNDIQVTHRRDAPLFAQSCCVSHAIVALPEARGSEIRGLIKSEARLFKHLLIIPDLAGLSSLWVETRDVGGLLGLQVSQTLLHQGPQMLKRASDILLACAAILILLPLILLVILAIRLTSPGAPFYAQSRIGRNGRRFTAWKFRSMCENADEVLLQQLDTNPELRREWDRDHKLRNDPRITPAGWFLRKTSLDELPQLWNVLRGEMSIVGPRPIVAAEIPRYGDAFDTYQSVRPGITGMWQVSGRNNTSYSERVQFDEYYVTNWSIWLDLYIIGRTFKTVLFGEGAF
jgi:Undecaprenyl-phosphate galactose phosphotransferase WbaP